MPGKAGGKAKPLKKAKKEKGDEDEDDIAHKKKLVSLFQTASMCEM